jgi:vacuolar protein sorting-associated protein 13D
MIESYHNSKIDALGAGTIFITLVATCLLFILMQIVYSYIDDVDSFHVMIRSADDSGRGTFIRVEVGTVGATFYTVFFDAANFPPPFRIDNFSEVPITYYQNGVQDVSQLRSIVKPHFSVPYALDEPTLDQQLSLAAPGGTTEIYNMNVIGAGIQLTYENFIYIAMTSTSESSDNNDSNLDWYGRIVVSHQPLVLDVEGTRVILAPKEAGKRSQLWRMTSTGMLVHEGSSPPQDPRKSIQSTFSDGLTTLPPLPNTNVLVLDIAGTAVQPHSYTPLMLRKPDERRQLTQRWKFTDDGRLVCSHRGLYVQAKDGFMGLVAGNLEFHANVVSE